VRRECRCTPATLIEGVVYPTCTDSSRERRERPMPQGFSACAYRTINPVHVEDARICLCRRDFLHRRPRRLLRGDMKPREPISEREVDGEAHAYSRDGAHDRHRAIADRLAVSRHGEPPARRAVAIGRPASRRFVQPGLSAAIAIAARQAGFPAVRVCGWYGDPQSARPRRMQGNGRYVLPTQIYLDIGKLSAHC